VRDGAPAAALPGWRPWEEGTGCTAVLGAPSRVLADPCAERRRAWRDAAGDAGTGVAAAAGPGSGRIGP
jgi:hypothetical protein